MNKEEYIVMIVFFVLATLCAVISVRQFKEKGFLFNNAYIWNSKLGREKMDKKPHYRQSAIAFCLLSIIFILSGISIIFKNDKIKYLNILFIIGLLIYVIISSIKIEQSIKR